jgi:hypothetical protein
MEYWSCLDWDWSAWGNGFTIMQWPGNIIEFEGRNHAKIIMGGIFECGGEGK